MKSTVLLASITLICTLPLLSLAAPITVDLTTFTQAAFESGTVSVAPDGSYADLSAYASWIDGDFHGPGKVGYAELYNNNLAIPANALTIQFDYDVSVAENGGDANFTACLYNSGGSISPFILEIGAGSSSGTETWTISGEIFVGGTIGLKFYADALDAGPDPIGDIPPQLITAAVSANISDVIITTREGPPIPEASTLMLFGSGLSGLAFYVRKRRLTRS